MISLMPRIIAAISNMVINLPPASSKNMQLYPTYLNLYYTES